MKTISIIMLFLVVACSKRKEDQSISSTIPTSSSQQKPETCKFGITDFNLSKRSFIQEPTASNRGPRGGTTPNAVILLDMDGYTVSNTQWNYNGNIVCSPANLSATDIETITQRVSIDYSPFNIIVTTDESLYNSAPATKRMRVIITETWEWYGQAGGTSFINSFTWGDNTPCFVFSSLLGYNIKQIAEVCSHEAGHTLGLYHQCVYDGNCVKTSEYNYGQGTGEIGWAPIMGVGYYQNLTLWYNGPNPYSCTAGQDDISIISSIIGLKTDDYPNSISNAPTLTTVLNGIINNSTDNDFFKIIFTGSKNIILSPVNAGTGNAGGNVDLVLKVYNSQGILLNTINNTSTLDAAITLTSGTYYVSASTESNTYATPYGMLGSYSISIN